jgi:hypothetical protein
MSLIGVRDWIVILIKGDRRMITLVPKKNTDSRFCRQSAWGLLLAGFHWIIHCFPGELSQVQHQVTFKIKIGFRAISGWNKALKHLFVDIWANQTYPFQVRQVKTESFLRVCPICFFCRTQRTHARKKEIFRRTRRRGLYSRHLQKVRLICSEILRRCFEGLLFLYPEIAW